MADLVQFAVAGGITFFGLLIGLPILFAIAQLFCLYTTVRERECQVFVLFGKVIGTLDEPGLHILPIVLGPRALLVRFFGRVDRVDLRIDQEYLRSSPVNSEEGAPMGIGVWYEMYVSDPVSYLFRNADPRGSLSANVSNAAVRTLSNMPLERMLIDRHTMSRTVRDDVSPKSQEWGYKLGSVYIRKVHFRDIGMIRQIEEKVVNRLRQVTSAIRQDGANQVSVITSTAERKAAVAFAEAAAMRPRIVGQALREIGRDAEVTNAMFAVLETESLIGSGGEIVLLPPGQELVGQLLAAGRSSGLATDPLPPPLPAPTRPRGPTAHLDAS
ncbi:MAG: SPFH/Band 7/PHB domain protein [Planctomycetes bacterium]|nr:SPFH/Band 7/PHB domain protein [Planctomycetota bacterium]